MRNKKVLIVDDEMDMRIFISTLLETSGYRPIIATNGEEGIQKARKHEPAAIILDVLMPKSGGVQMYREVKNRREFEEYPGDHDLGNRKKDISPLHANAQ